MKDVRGQIEELLAQRILVLDGAWGVLIHRRGLSEGEYRGERFREHHKDVQGDPDLLNLTHPEIVSRDPRRVLRRRRRHRDDEHLHGDENRSGRLRPGRRRGRDEPRRRAPRAARRRRMDVEDTREAPLRSRIAGAAQRHALALAAGRRRRVSSGDLRPGSRDVRGADRRPAGRRRRPAHGRDDLRHAERQGRDRRRRATSRPSSRSGSRSLLWTGVDATSPARPQRRSGSPSNMRSR